MSYSCCYSNPECVYAHGCIAVISSFFHFLWFMLLYFPIIIYSPVPSPTFPPTAVTTPLLPMYMSSFSSLPSPPSPPNSPLFLYSFPPESAVLCHLWNCCSHYLKKIFYVQVHIIASLKVNDICFLSTFYVQRHFIMYVVSNENPGALQGPPWASFIQQILGVTFMFSALLRYFG